MDRPKHHTRKEEWRTESADIPFSEAGNDLYLIKHRLYFEGNLGETAERRDGARMDLSERYHAFLRRN